MQGIASNTPHSMSVSWISRLPDGDGLDLMAEADTLGLSLPIIPLTGFPSIDQDKRALSLGAAGFLEKDKLDPLTLERTIRYAIHQRKVTEGVARQAFVDEKTGLIRPGLYRERLSRALAFAKRRDRELAVMMIDLAFDADVEDREGLGDAALATETRPKAGWRASRDRQHRQAFGSAPRSIGRRHAQSRSRSHGRPKDPQTPAPAHRFRGPNRLPGAEHRHRHLSARGRERARP